MDLTIDERMNSLWTIRKYAQWKKGTDAPTKAQENYYRRQCQEGVLAAVKWGNEWRIDMIAELKKREKECTSIISAMKEGAKDDSEKSGAA